MATTLAIPSFTLSTTILSLTIIPTIKIASAAVLESQPSRFPHNVESIDPPDTHPLLARDDGASSAAASPALTASTTAATPMSILGTSLQSSHVTAAAAASFTPACSNAEDCCQNAACNAYTPSATPTATRNGASSGLGQTMAWPMVACVGIMLGIGV